jgi:hypothetical protein
MQRLWKALQLPSKLLTNRAYRVELFERVREV